MYMIFRCYYSNREVVIDSEAPLQVCKATEPPAIKIREINLRSCRRESNPRRQRDERASNPLGHRGMFMQNPCKIVLWNAAGAKLSKVGVNSFLLSTQITGYS